MKEKQYGMQSLHLPKIIEFYIRIQMLLSKT